MVVAGVLFGLGAAAAQSVSYIFTRLYVIRRHDAVIRLLVLGHVIMGVVSAVLLPVVWSAQAPPLAEFILPLLAAAGATS